MSEDKDARLGALTSSMISAFVMSFMGSALNVALPSIGEEFQADALLLGWVATSFLLASAVFLVPFGRLADILGRRRVFTAGLVLFMLTSLASVFVTSIETLISLRVLQGLSGSMVFSTGMAILTSVFPPQERGRVLGWNVSFVYLGLTTGPFLGGILTESFGWRSIFILNTLMCAIAVLFVILKLKGEWREAHGEKFDVLGSLIFAGAITALVFGLSRMPSLQGALLFLVGVVLSVLFVFVEQRLESPVMNVRMFFDNRVFAFANLAALIHYSSAFGVSFLLSLYLQYVKDKSPQEAGYVLMTQPVLMMLLAPVAGRLSDRMQPGTLASVGMGLTASGLFMLVALSATTSLVFIICSLALIGLGFGFFSSPNTNAAMGAVDRKQYGVASASLGTMRTLGQMAGLALSMMALSMFVGHEQISKENHPAFIHAMTLSLIAFGTLCLLGIGVSLLGRNVRRNLMQ